MTLAFIVALIICFVQGFRKLLRTGRARLAEERATLAKENDLREAQRLYVDFARQYEVLTTKLKNGEKISPAAVNHYEDAYKKLMPLLLSHRLTLNSHIRKAFREEGDYGEAPDVVKACDQMHNNVTKQIQDANAGSVKEAQAIDDLLLAFGSEIETLQKDFTREGLARLRERAESLKLALPRAAKYWNVEKIETVRRMLAKTDETVAPLGKENAEGADSDESKNPHEVPGVAPTASEDCQLIGVGEYYTLDELNAARRTKAAQWHSDKISDMAPELKEFADQQLARVNGAYERLANRVKWHSEPKSLLAEAQDAFAIASNVHREWDQALVAVSSGGSLENIEKIIERYEDSIRRMRACRARTLREAPTANVTELERCISATIANSRKMREFVQKYQELEISKLQYKEVARQVAELENMEI